MKILMVRSSLLILFVFGVLMAHAQEMLVDLNGNPMLREAWQHVQRNANSSSRDAGDTLQLPFFDDFSEPFTRLNHPVDMFPNTARWSGPSVYVNNHMGINPPSQGVATFDGLDEKGQAYGFGSSLPSLADSLTSLPINLSSTTDTVFLSFFYQAQGMGNAPESEDILVLEFKDSGQVWTRVWEVAGYILEDYKFNQVMLPVLGDEYLYNGFQFRFLNYASRAGSVDHWHIDYVELDGGRTSADTTVKDMAFIGQTSWDNDTIGFQNANASLLNDYSSMPWTHYKHVASIGDPLTLMGDTNYFLIHNNADTIMRGDYKFVVFDNNGAQVFDDSLYSPIVDPWVVCGNESNTCNLNQFSNYSFWTDNWSFPTGAELSEDSAYFLVKHLMLNLEDDYHVNDTSVFKQIFYNYYSYDDGTAELGYGLGNLENDGMVAVKYDVKKQDFLRAIQLYLNPVDQDLSAEPVKLMVWSGGNEPENVKYESPEFITFNYSEGMNYFYHYFLEEPIEIQENESIWVGWLQQAATGIKFSVGFDRRSDHSQKVYYNLGTTWNQSGIPGTVMIRPVLGQAYDWQVGIDEQTVEDVTLYPNPTTGMVYLQGVDVQQLRNATIQVLDVAGREVYTQTGYTNGIDLGLLKAGTYLVNVQLLNGQRITKRVVLQ